MCVHITIKRKATMLSQYVTNTLITVEREHAHGANNNHLLDVGI